MGHVGAEVDHVARGERGGAPVHVHLDRAAQDVHPLLAGVCRRLAQTARQEAQLDGLQPAQRGVRQRLQRHVAGSDRVPVPAARYVDHVLLPVTRPRARPAAHRAPAQAAAAAARSACAGRFRAARDARPRSPTAPTAAPASDSAGAGDCESARRSADRRRLGRRSSRGSLSRLPGVPCPRQYIDSLPIGNFDCQVCIAICTTQGPSIPT